MAYETILTEKRGPAFIITLNRPKVRNAISVKAMHEIIAAAEEADKDPEIFGVILTGGTEFFSAGADLNDAQALRGPVSTMNYLKNWHRLTDTFENLTKPTLAVIEGFCMTGGFELALAFDIRIAGEGSSFTITSSRIGTVAGAGGTQRLPRIVGLPKALEIMFAAEPIDAQEAAKIGLLNHLTPRGGAMSKALEMVALYATRAPISLALVKRAIYRGMQTDLASAMELEKVIVAAIYETEDRTEGIKAFFEKRPAQFKGK